MSRTRSRREGFLEESVRPKKRDTRRRNERGARGSSRVSLESSRQVVQLREKARGAMVKRARYARKSLKMGRGGQHETPGGGNCPPNATMATSQQRLYGTRRERPPQRGLSEWNKRFEKR
ncbi:hypothetical protein F5J12DRAFT_783744 [Pisolithus orientalis]|uniref:uncharacterized protein n=1 Tax=Pisolithus orientalis TaxID=936130 RepID=UPI002224BDF1|nr:uncharacterized protein F5J12DRAFT_783744 [Pisolithus orientalis]KAI6002567.1 hypothetical protein F5J12DRAFT_783744 [Pisolithus orientalis]